MIQYIDKAAVVAEIERLISSFDKCPKLNDTQIAVLEGNKVLLLKLLSFLNTLETKELKEYKQPEHSYLETVYQCGKKPRWNIGDILAYYEFYSDREGECVLGKITKVDFDEEQCDWIYTFEDGGVCNEQTLLEEETYKKN